MKALLVSLSVLALLNAALSASPKTVQVVNYPLQYFAERILGDELGEAAVVEFLAPADVDPAFWKPSDDAVIAFQGADLILKNGAGYAKWMERYSLPRSILFNTSSSFQDDYLVVKDAVTHSHGDGELHSHDGIAFTTWLDFQQARKQAGAVKEALIELIPDSTELLERNAAALDSDLAALDAKMSALAKSLGKIPLIVSHPVYHYFKRRYALPIEAVHWEPDIIPVGESLEELEGVLENHPSKWMVWEGEPGSVAVEVLEEMEIGSVVFDPCANRPKEGDWFSVMQSNLEGLAQIAGAEKEN